MLYQKLDPPEYVSTEGSKNVRITTKISIAVLALIIIVLVACWENINTTFGYVLLLGALMGLVTKFVLALYFPNEKKDENKTLFQEYHKFPPYLLPAEIHQSDIGIPAVPSVIWLKDNELHISAGSQKNDFGELIIPIENIAFFVRDGDFYTKTEINREGRIVGGLLAGTPGYLMGTNVSADTIEVDKRSTIVYLENRGEEATLKFDSETYNSLMDLVPQLEYKRVMSKQQISKKSDQEPNDLDQIKKLKELLDMGAITQQEFEDKKKDLLGI